MDRIYCRVVGGLRDCQDAWDVVPDDGSDPDFFGSGGGGAVVAQQNAETGGRGGDFGSGPAGLCRLRGWRVGRESDSGGIGEADSDFIADSDGEVVELFAGGVVIADWAATSLS